MCVCLDVQNRISSRTPLPFGKNVLAFSLSFALTPSLTACLHFIRLFSLTLTFPKLRPEWKRFSLNHDGHQRRCFSTQQKDFCHCHYHPRGREMDPVNFDYFHFGNVAKPASHARREEEEEERKTCECQDDNGCLR